MEVLLFLPLVMAAYLIYARIQFGMTRSISSTYGKLKGKAKLLPFIVLILSVIVPAIVLGVNANPESPFRFLWWGSGMLILLVGMYADPKSKTGDVLHVVGATGGIALGMLAPAITLEGWWTIVFPSVFAVFVGMQELFPKLKLKNNTYWTEVIAIAIVMGLLVKEYVL